MIILILNIKYKKKYKKTFIKKKKMFFVSIIARQKNYILHFNFYLTIYLHH